MSAAIDREKIAWVERVLGCSIPDGAEDDVSHYDSAELADQSDTGAYGKYLRGRLKMLRREGAASFGFVAGQKPEEHRLALAPRGSPHTLASKLAADTGLKQMTWGTASPHRERTDTVLLELEGPLLPGLKKKCGRMLNYFRPQPARIVQLRVNNAEVEDLPDDDEDGGPPPGLVGLVGADAAELTVQGQTFAGAAEAGMAFCEECPAPEPGPA